MLCRQTRLMVIVGAGLFGAFLAGGTSNPPALPDLAEERLRVARSALARLEGGDSEGPVRLADRTPWLRRIAEIRRDHGGEAAEVLADLHAYAAHLDDLEAELVAEAGSRPASGAELDEVRYARVETATWIAEASKVRPGRSLALR